MAFLPTGGRRTKPILNSGFRAKLQEDGWTQQKLGEVMGYAPASARKNVNQFLKSHDPAISMLCRFAKAAGVPLGQLLGDSS